MKSTRVLKTIFSVIAIVLLSAITVLFSVLYVNTFSGGFFYENKNVLIASVTVLVAVITVISLAFSIRDNKLIFKLSVIALALISAALLLLYILKITGISDKIDSIEDLRNYVASFGYLAVVIYVLLNFLQVVAIPIPGFIAIGTGVALFGPLKTAIFAFIGITAGSLVAFFIGRHLGYKVVVWLIGKETLDKWLNSVKNKDKIVLTFMFLFPFFPDDVLCFVAGLSTMSSGYFIIMIIICRLISIFLSAYSMNGNIIPFTTWWGLVLWALVIGATIIITILLYKNGDKVEQYFKNRRKKRRDNLESNTTRRP